MQPVTAADLDLTLRALLASPRPVRGALALRLIRRAQTAHRFWLRTGRRHPDWGGGTLSEVAQRQRLAAPAPFDVESLDALILLRHALLDVSPGIFPKTP